MSDAIVVDIATRRLNAFGMSIPCGIGRAGSIAAAAKREGDGATPLGRWPIRAALLRPGGISLPIGSRLPWRWIRADDGWSDDPRDPAYNRPVRHPHLLSAEHLWRDDGLYDLVVVLGYNDSPPVPFAGSAIFLHCGEPGQATEGCVAIPTDALAALLGRISLGDVVAIR